MTGEEERLAKSVALLNLVSTTGTVRASRHVLALTDIPLEDTLAELENAGVVTYRDFADEFRIWQGSDVDIRLLLESARQQVRQQPLVEVLATIDEPNPVIAAGHSAKHSVLRVFKTRYCDGGERIEPLDAFSPFDGRVLLCVGGGQSVPNVGGVVAESKPVVAASTQGCLSP